MFQLTLPQKCLDGFPERIKLASPVFNVGETAQVLRTGIGPGQFQTLALWVAANIYTIAIEYL